MPNRTVQDLMTTGPACCTPQDAIVTVAQQMVREDCGAIPVVQNMQTRRLVGILTDRDIVCRVVANELDPATTTVQDAMSTENLATVRPDASFDHCVRVMSDRQVRRIPVVDSECRLIGIVAQADLARASADDDRLDDEVSDMLEEVSEPAGTI